MDKKQKKRMDVLQQKIQKTQQLLAAAPGVGGRGAL